MFIVGYPYKKYDPIYALDELYVLNNLWYYILKFNRYSYDMLLWAIKKVINKNLSIIIDFHNKRGDGKE